MKDADKMAKLLEAAKIVLEEDIIPSLPSRKRLSALLVEEALSIALNTTDQLVRQEENETAKNNKLLSNQLDQVFMTLLWMGRLLRSYLRMSQKDWKHPLRISKYIKNSLNI